MTQARSHLIPIGASGTYHCVQHCVRRAFLCGIDHYTSQSFEHRKAWVEERIALVGECYPWQFMPTPRTPGHPQNPHFPTLISETPYIAAKWDSSH